MDTPMATTNPTNEIIDMDAPNTVPVTRDVLCELAAVSAAILDTRAEKTQTAKKFNIKIKDLEKRQLELIDEVKRGGTQLAINFGTTVATMKAAASNAADDAEFNAAIDDADAEIEDTGSDDDTETDDEFAEEEPEETH